MPKQNIEALPRCLSKNWLFFGIIQNEIRQSPYGQQTYNVTLVDGVARIASLNIVKQRRRRYKQALDKKAQK